MKLETFSLDVDADGIAVATFDVPGRSMNTLTARAIQDLEAIADEVGSNATIKGLVITSGKTSGFCAGADLGELGGGSVDGDKSGDPEAQLKAAFDRAFQMNKILRNLETCKKPVACAINGLALGGGFEVALGCHYRIAANDNPKFQLGLPEAKVGLMPGGGGTQRLPRLIGAQAAAPYLLQGENMTAQQAKDLGVVHELAPTAQLVGRAKEWVKANPNAKAPWDDAKFKIPGGKPDSQQGSMVFTFGAAMLAKQTWGNYPAQKHILSAVYEGLSVPMDAALRIESRYFVKTLMTPEAKGMIRSLFLSMQDLSKGASRPAGYPTYDIKKAIVVGAGLMGAGIAYVQAKAGIPTVLLDVSQESADKGKAYSQRIVEKDVSRGKISKEKGEALLALITPSTDYSLVKGADIVVEAVFENSELKAKVTAQIEEHLGETAVMGTNTSTLPITGLAKASKRPANFIGIHFFSPVERMGLVEIIMGKETTQETLAKTMDYVLKIKKTPVAVNDFRGFYTSRVFGTYPEEGMTMLTEGIAPAIVENVGRMAGMPMGPLEVSDSVGIDTMLKIGRESAKAAGKSYDQNPVGDMVAWIVDTQNRVGRKAGKGFYDYNEAGKPSRLYPDLGKKIEVKVKECPPELKTELTKRMLYRQCVEVARCFEEGVITDARDADIGSILAWGFAPYSGGVCSYMDLKVGIKTFVQECDRLAEAYGERFRPNALLREMAAKGQTFYSRFPPKDQKAAA
ncbi:MAG: enoyl-CoA hydratase/isomerase family protein [Hyphomonadaceae bacterium]|nr:enoyl-CoA hydratase/isomerase family protein [Hyphomonadaceae bacterium]